MNTRLNQKTIWLTLVAITFGYCEAATVAYIRLVGAIPRGADYREAWSLRGLSLNSDTVLSEMGRMGVLGVEYGREIATLLLLLGVAMSAGSTKRERIEWFIFCFAVWDLTYYLWLALFCGFPKNLLQTDIYFLLPFPTFGPIWFPVVVMTIGACWAMCQICPRPKPDKSR